MAETKQTLTQTDESGINSNGTAVQQQTTQTRTTETADPKTTAQNVVWYVLGLVEVLLAFRFILKLFGANPASSFVDIIYSVTGVLTAPFDSIFGTASTQSGSVESVFEPSILVAAAVYAIIAWGIVKLITINKQD